MSQYLLDTNHVSHLLQGHALLISRIQQSNGSFGISMTILGELYFAAYASQRTQKNLTPFKISYPMLLSGCMMTRLLKSLGGFKPSKKPKVAPFLPLTRKLPP